MTTIITIAALIIMVAGLLLSVGMAAASFIALKEPRA